MSSWRERALNEDDEHNEDVDEDVDDSIDQPNEFAAFFRPGWPDSDEREVSLPSDSEESGSESGSDEEDDQNGDEIIDDRDDDEIIDDREDEGTIERMEEEAEELSILARAAEEAAQEAEAELDRMTDQCTPTANASNDNVEGDDVVIDESLSSPAPAVLSDTWQYEEKDGVTVTVHGGIPGKILMHDVLGRVEFQYMCAAGAHVKDSDGEIKGPLTRQHMTYCRDADDDATKDRDSGEAGSGESHAIRGELYLWWCQAPPQRRLTNSGGSQTKEDAPRWRPGPSPPRDASRCSAM